MLKLKSLYPFVAGALTLHSAAALSANYINGCSLNLTDKNTHVYFINGAGTPYFSAEASLAALMANAGKSNFLFRMSYYPSPIEFELIEDSLASVINGAGIQSESVVASTVIGWLSNGVTLDVAHDFIRASIHTNDAESIIEKLNDDVWASLQTAYTEAFIEATRTASEPTYKDLNYYEADLLAGKRVMLVSHSHGSAVATNALLALEERQPTLMSSVGAVYVAPVSPLSPIHDGSFYVSASDDVALNSLREIGIPVPQANLTQNGNGVGNRDHMNHDFLLSYYNDELDSFAAINNVIDELNASLVTPPQRAGTGAIRASLTWDYYGDMDIYIEEPNGEMLWYANTEGELKSGSIDVDNRRGFGPENYFVPCDRLVEGRYVFGANYYSAPNAYERDRPLTAKITLLFGNGQIPKPVELTFPHATSSPSTQEMMIEVNVTTDADGNLYYDYLPLVEPK